MNAATLRMGLFTRGAEPEIVGGDLVVTAPKGAITPELAAEVKRYKAGLMTILRAEAECNALHRRVFELVDAAEANDLYGATVEAVKQRAEAKALIEGPYWDANQKLLGLLAPDAFAELDRWLQNEIGQEVHA